MQYFLDTSAVVKLCHQEMGSDLAIMVLVHDRKIGNIGRGLLNTFHRWLNTESEITAVIEKINGRPDRPSIMLYIAVGPQGQVEHAFAS